MNSLRKRAKISQIWLKEQKMKILILTPTFFPFTGGAERGIYEITRRLAARHQVLLLTPKPGKKYRQDYSSLFKEIKSRNTPVLGDDQVFGIKRFRDTWNMIEWPGQGKLGGIIPPFSPSSVWATVRVARHFQPDVLCVFYGLPSGLAGLVAKKRLGLPFVLALIGRDIPGPNFPPLWKKYLAFVAHRADRIIFISKYCRERLSDRKNLAGEIIPFGVDFDTFKPQPRDNYIRKRFGIPGSRPLLFSVQRLDPWKKTEVLIRTIHFLDKSGLAVSAIIGGIGPEKKKLEHMIHRLNLENKVFLPGFIPERELPVYYASADIFCFHSTFETFGLVLLEAMASGKPIVTVRSTAIPELIEDRKTGLLVETESPQQLAQAIAYLLENQELREKLGQEARSKALEFSWTKVAQQYEKVLTEAAKKLRGVGIKDE